MGWLARVIVPSAAVVFIGCAAIANFGDTETTTGEQNTGSSGTSGASGMPSGTPNPSRDGGTGTGTVGDGGTPMPMDAAIDSAPPCAAGKQQNGGGCTAPSDCCSAACGGDHRCTMSCAPANGGCGGDSDCCVGLYCPQGFSNRRCAACRPNDAGAEAIGPVVFPGSCCSGNVDLQTAKCIP